MSSVVTYVDVILPLALPQAYTYAVPIDLVSFVKVGQRVIVQFGKNRFYSAIVKTIHNKKPAVEAKLIETIAEEDAIVTEMQLRFWKWISTYYMCTEGEVMNAALPSGLKLSSETKIRYNESYEGDFETLNDDEFLIVQALRAQGEIKIPQVQDLLKKKNVYPFLKTLFNLSIAISSEEIQEKFKPRTETYVKLNEKYSDNEALGSLYDDLSRAPKQVELLLAFTQLHLKTKFIRKNELLALSKSSAAVLSALVKRDVFTEFKMEVSRLGNMQTAEVDSPELNEPQKVALAEINEQLQHKSVVLLHGVTGSGKTNIYIEKIKEVLAEGKQVLYLLPEIALTAQIINRLRKIFGTTVGIYHSKFNQNERVEIWNKVLHGEYKIVVGARSGIFLPYKNLGLIIVDEEHDNSMKQMDPAPRYNARDSSIVLAGMFDAKVILGTATPATESLHNAETGKYGLVKLMQRYGGLEMPGFLIANIKDDTKWGRMRGSFTELLIDQISMALNNKEQVILFLNRRGFANYQVCKTCNHVYKCKNCDVSLTYHKFSNQLKCHYCGYFEKVVNKCKSCGAIDLDIVGMGTEKVEDEIAELFPTAKVTRLDYDAMKTKNGHAKVIAEFENREVDILVGTQMVTKGLDFDHVSLVGIINADQLINFPGFRAHERAFQLMMQVAGRAGRKNKKGKVVIQTSNPAHPVIYNVLNSDFKRMYQTEVAMRRQFQYPPFVRVIEVTLKHSKVHTIEQAALFMANELRKTVTGKVLGPGTPFISKINNLYIREILIKSALDSTQLSRVKQALHNLVDKMKAHAELKSVSVSVDVDP
ncbi:MAG TPA: primosomal protein N' [Chitinophagales bacterium]|nr:primosomal protein N' [Chitinophagales bacterium]